MDYTREPIVETVITPKDGCRIVVRNSKVPGQEEYIVEALEVVSFGTNCFFRNLERPRAFMVPASDYEVLEVREGRVPLKAASLEGPMRAPVHRETPKSHKETEKKEVVPPQAPLKEPSASVPEGEDVVAEEERAEAIAPSSSVIEGRHDRRRDRRRGQRRRRGSREESSGDEIREGKAKGDLPQVVIPPVLEPTSPLAESSSASEIAKEATVPPVLTTVLPPPTTLIRDDLERLRRNKQYEGAFYIRDPVEEQKEEVDDDDAPIVPLRLHESENEPAEESSRFPREENFYTATPLSLEEEMGLSWEEGGVASPSEKRSPTAS